jgi:hypothetical protein
VANSTLQGLPNLVLEAHAESFRQQKLLLNTKHSFTRSQPGHDVQWELVATLAPAVGCSMDNLLLSLTGLCSNHYSEFSACSCLIRTHLSIQIAPNSFRWRDVLNISRTTYWIMSSGWWTYFYNIVIRFSSKWWDWISSYFYTSLSHSGPGTILLETWTLWGTWTRPLQSFLAGAYYTSSLSPTYVPTTHCMKH